MGILRYTLLWASHNAWLKERVPRQAFVRRAVRRFMPGEDAAAALAAAEVFQQQGIGSVLTVLGEDLADESEARSVVDEYGALLGEIARRSLDAEISVKPTHLGLDLGADVAAAGLDRLAALSAAHGKVMWIDMEGSQHTDATLALYARVRASQPGVGLCLQSYLRRTGADLESLLAEPTAVRLVKGAYAEPGTIAYTRKAEVDARFLELAGRLLAAAAGQPRARVGIATHDRRLIGRVIEAAESSRVPRSAYEFQMLYGIQRDEQLRLARAGYRVRVLISFGPAWFPWYLRRLAERPANLWFVLRNLVAR